MKARPFAGILAGLLALGLVLALPARAETTRITFRELSEDSLLLDVAPPDSGEEGAWSEADSTRGERHASGDLVRIGGDIRVRDEQTIEGDVVAIGGDVEVRGHVTGDVQAIGGDVLLTNTARVDGDVLCLGGTLREERGSRVSGRHVTSPRMPGGKLLLPFLAAVGTGVRMVVDALSALFLIAIAWLFVKLAPRRTTEAIDRFTQEPARPLVATGLLLLVLVPSVIALAIAMVLLCITILGIPLAILLPVFYGALLLLLTVWGSVVGYALFGRMVARRFQGIEVSLVRAVVTGVLVVFGLRLAGDLLHVVPVLGFLGGLLLFLHWTLVVVLGLLGAGALIESEYRRRTLQDWWRRIRPATPSPAPGDVPPPPAPDTGNGPTLHT